jgi:hypothetical protein
VRGKLAFAIHGFCGWRSGHGTAPSVVLPPNRSRAQTKKRSAAGLPAGRARLRPRSSGCGPGNAAAPSSSSSSSSSSS